MFVLSSAGDHDRARVAIAGTSNTHHPSGRDSLVAPAFPTYRGSGSIGIGGGGGGSSLGIRSSSGGSHSPVLSGSGHVRRDSGGGSSMHSGLVPAEAESSPPEMMDADGRGGGGVGGGVGGRGGDRGGGARGGGARGGGKKKSKKGSKSSRRDGGSSRSSSRRSVTSDGGMRPAMPDDGPTDEMRPSPATDGSGPPGPWAM